MGEYPFQKLAANQSAHANRVGMKATLLLIRNEPSSPAISAISDSHPIKRSGFFLDNTATEPPIVHPNQATTNVSVRGQGDHNVSLGSL